MLNEFVRDGESGAVFSPCRTYRYSLWRRFYRLFLTPMEERLIVYIGLNPSTANEDYDDPTMTRLTSFSKQFGYDGFVMLNLFGLVSTDPVPMLKHESPTGPDNNRAIDIITSEAAAVVCCWGSHGSHRDRHKEVYELLKFNNIQAFDVNQDGQPKHPLYVKGDTLLDKFTPFYKPHPLRYHIQSFRNSWKPPENGVPCTRPGRWGNPYRIGEKHPVTGKPMTRSECIQAFVDKINTNETIEGEINRMAIVEELRGKPLGCHCHLNEPCHVDALATIANQE